MRSWSLCMPAVACVLSMCAPARPNLALGEAARQGDLGQVEAHLYHGSDVNIADEQGLTPLGQACRAGQLAVAAKLLDHGAEANPGLVPAALAGHRDLVALLVDRGAEVNRPDEQGRTPLQAAAGHALVQALLRERGAKESAQELAERLLRHMDAIFGLILEYQSDCNGAVREVEAYLAKHSAEIASLDERLKALDETASEQERSSQEQFVRQKAEALMRKAMDPMLQFAQKCPDQLASIGQALQSFSK